MACLAKHDRVNFWHRPTAVTGKPSLQQQYIYLEIPASQLSAELYPAYQAQDTLRIKRFNGISFLRGRLPVGLLDFGCCGNLVYTENIIIVYFRLRACSTFLTCHVILIINYPFTLYSTREEKMINIALEKIHN